MTEFAEILTGWLVEKHGYNRELIREPSLSTDEGWIGTEVTPGDPPSCEVVFTYEGVKRQVNLEIDDMGKFVEEIAAISARIQAGEFWAARDA